MIAPDLRRHVHLDVQRAETVEEAEEQFTDDFARLMSRHDDAVNDVVISGE